MKSLAPVVESLLEMRPGGASDAEAALQALVGSAAPGEFDPVEVIRARELAASAARLWHELAALAALDASGYSRSGAPSAVAVVSGGICG